MNVEIRARVLQELVRPMKVFDNGWAKITIRSSRLIASQASADGKRSVKVAVSADAFESWEGDPAETYSSFKQLSNVVTLVNHDSTIQIRIDPDTDRTYVEGEALIGKFIPRVPTMIPEINKHPGPHATIVFPIDEFVKFGTCGTSLSHQVTLQVNENESIFHATATGDCDQVDLYVTSAEAIDFSLADVSATFGATDLNSVLQSIPDGTVIKLFLADEKPVGIEYPIAGGHGTVRYRIENKTKATLD
jgi:hypothetical protein